jgi:NADPH:quinone reductase-like Zn-dependent oxidoreductase
MGAAWTISSRQPEWKPWSALLTKAGASDCQIALVGVLRLGNAQAGLNLSALAGGFTLRRIRVGSRTAYEAMNRAIALHRLRPVIDRSFEFAEARAAYTYFSGMRNGVGKVVVSVD